MLVSGSVLIDYSHVLTRIDSPSNANVAHARPHMRIERFGHQSHGGQPLYEWRKTNDMNNGEYLEGVKQLVFPQLAKGISLSQEVC